MEQLFERLLKRTFPDSVTAIEYCRNLCAEFGFTVKQEASANRVTSKRHVLFRIIVNCILHDRTSMSIVLEKVSLIRSEIQSPHRKGNVHLNAATADGASCYLKTSTNNGNFANL